MRTAILVLLSVFSIQTWADEFIEMPVPNPEVAEIETIDAKDLDQVLDSAVENTRAPASVESSAPVGEVSAKDRKDMVMKTISRNFTSLKSCYKAGLKKNGKMEGKVVMGWDLDAEGRVVKATVDNSQLGNKEVEACMVQRFSEWDFPAAAKIKNSQGRMTYTFTFTPESVR
jgi:hypothetical protein